MIIRYPTGITMTASNPTLPVLTRLSLVGIAGKLVASRLIAPTLAAGSIPATSTSKRKQLVMRWWGCAFCEYAMTEDWFAGAVEGVAETGRQACLAIETAVRALREGGEARNAGRSIVEVVDQLIAADGRETRLSAAEAFREYERAIASMRAGVVRALVDEGGLSLTDVARRMKISRQAAARLYEPARESEDEGPD
ncbi:MAG: hypothetical protein QOF18_2008 [Frankiaceae bacterium]|nr:hypothetical protein [Frankiaceae bacterium]